MLLNYAIDHLNVRKPLKIGGGGGGGSGGGGITAKQAHRKERRITYKIKKNRKFSHTKVTDQNNSVDNTKYNTMLFSLQLTCYVEH